MKGRYDQAVDRESAYELLKQRTEDARAATAQEAEKKRYEKEMGQQKQPGRQRQSMGEAMAKSAARAIGSQIGRQIVRGVLGAIFGRSSRR